MKKFKILTQPTKRDASFDDFYEGIADEWELRAQRLQERRWRKLREELA